MSLKFLVNNRGIKCSTVVGTTYLNWRAVSASCISYIEIRITRIEYIGRRGYDRINNYIGFNLSEYHYWIHSTMIAPAAPAPPALAVPAVPEPPAPKLPPTFPGWPAKAVPPRGPGAPFPATKVDADKENPNVPALPVERYVNVPPLVVPPVPPTSSTGKIAEVEPPAPEPPPQLYVVAPIVIEVVPPPPPIPPAVDPAAPPAPIAIVKPVLGVIPFMDKTPKAPEPPPPVTAEVPLQPPPPPPPPIKLNRKMVEVVIPAGLVHVVPEVTTWVWRFPVLLDVGGNNGI